MRQTFYSGRRVAEIEDIGQWMTLWLFDDEPDPLFPHPNNTMRVLDVPRTRENLRHLRQFATDWAAHGISWCDRTARGGVLPMRGGADPVVETMGPVWKRTDETGLRIMAERERMKVVTRD